MEALLYHNPAETWDHRKGARGTQDFIEDKNSQDTGLRRR